MIMNWGNYEILSVVIYGVILVVVGILFIHRKIKERRYKRALELEFIREKEEQERNLFYSVTNPNRGTQAERELVWRLLKGGVPAQTIFHDLYVRKPNGRFSQVDLVVPTKAGIIVFEVKDYSGWIFGKGHQEQWTQVLAYGREKYRFYNPIMQNQRHIEELRKQLRQFEKIPFFSIIVFDGYCELRDISFIPHGTFIVKPRRVMEVLNIIIKDNPPVAYADKMEIAEMLRSAVQNGGNMAIQSQHTENVKDMLGKERIFD
jgi:hypothetical protein